MNILRKILTMLYHPTNRELQTANCELRTIIFLILPLLLFTWSCEENFDVNAPYKDITIVFGLLDPAEDTVFLKINKAFLGDGNVMEMAKIEDSSIYVNGLQATIEEWENGDFIKSYTLDTITINNKEEGTFYNPYQIIYFTTYEPVTSREYRLKVIVNSKEITAKTNLINDFNISKPNAGSASVQFSKGNEGTIEWKSAEYGKRYEVVIRIHYKEVLFNSTDTAFKYIDWGMGTKKSTSDKGGEEMIIKYSNDNFYNILHDQVPYEDPATEANVKERFTNNVDFIIAVAANELNTYMEVNEPSNSIIQERPEFSNVTNGMGIFSSRFKNMRTKKIALLTVATIKTDLPELKFVY
jgi:hypothetical protein